MRLAVVLLAAVLGGCSLTVDRVMPKPVLGVDLTSWSTIVHVPPLNGAKLSVSGRFN